MPASTLAKKRSKKTKKIPTLAQMMSKKTDPADRLEFTTIGLLRLGEVLRLSRERLIYQDYSDEAPRHLSLRLLEDFIYERTGESISKDTLWQLEKGIANNPQISTLLALSNAEYITFPDEPDKLMDLFDLIDIATGRFVPIGTSDLLTFEELCVENQSGSGFNDQGLKLLGQICRHNRLAIEIYDEVTRIRRSITTAELSKLIRQRTGITVTAEEIELLEEGILKDLEPRIFMALEATRFVYKKDQSTLYTGEELIDIAAGNLHPNGKKQANGN